MDGNDKIHDEILPTRWTIIGDIPILRQALYDHIKHGDKLSPRDESKLDRACQLHGVTKEDLQDFYN